MTPEQANRAAAVLELHAPTDPEGYAACLATVEYLRNLAAAKAGTWSIHCRDLFAADPGGRVLTFPRISGFAYVTPAMWSRPGSPVRIGFRSRETAKAQRYRLAERLRQRGLHTLAQAVEDIKLHMLGPAVMATYDPAGMPLRVIGN